MYCSVQYRRYATISGRNMRCLVAAGKQVNVIRAIARLKLKHPICWEDEERRYRVEFHAVHSRLHSNREMTNDSPQSVILLANIFQINRKHTCHSIRLCYSSNTFCYIRHVHLVQATGFSLEFSDTNLLGIYIYIYIFIYIYILSASLKRNVAQIPR
jgi:hypothetical protein